MNNQPPQYDRELLLFSEKRNAVLSLWEVQRYGSDSYGDIDYLSLYGMPPAEWYSKGVRVLGRTAVECTRDVLANAIGKDVAKVAATCPPPLALIVDPFAGSGNTLYWLLHHLPDARCVGFESDAGVFQLTRKNIAALELPIDIQNVDYSSGLTGVSVPLGELLVAFIAPPWGSAFDKTSGLDLLCTTPPITEIVDFLLHRFPHNRLLCAIQVHQRVFPFSMIELRARFDWSTLRIYDFNMPEQNHGILIATRGWTPPSR
jgi:hypothetical protein